MKTRSPLLADTIGHELVGPAPLFIPTNPHPHSCHYFSDLVHVTSGGYDGSETTTSHAMVQAYNWRTGIKEKEFDIGLRNNAQLQIINTPAGLCDAGGHLIVCNQYAHTVFRLDPATYQMVGSPMAVGLQPVDACRDIDGNVWVSCREAPKIIKIDPVNWTILGEITTGITKPFKMARWGRYMLVPSFNDAVLYFVDATISPISAAIVGTAPVNVRPNCVWVENNFAYVACMGDSMPTGPSRISRVNLTTRTLDASFAMSSDTAAPHGVFVYDDMILASCAGDGKLRIMSKFTGRSIEDIQLGPNAAFGCFGPDHALWVANPFANGVWCFTFKSVWG